MRTTDGMGFSSGSAARAVPERGVPRSGQAAVGVEDLPVDPAGRAGEEGDRLGGSGADRTYRLSRVLEAEEISEPARRPDQVHLDRVWPERCAQFLSGDRIVVLVRVAPQRRQDLMSSAVAVRAAAPDPDGRLRLEVTYQDLRHAEWAL
ncbi:hypothetical protein HDC93_003091 [Streptomyces sp. AK010]|nr:hypothetical protein [Streptomyces sp. AK010]